MKCNNCGIELPDNAEACEKCGQKINNEKENKKPGLVRRLKKLFRKESNEKLAALIVPICAVLLIAAVLFLIVSSFVEINEEIEVEDYYVTVYDEKENVTYFLFKGKLVDGFLYGKCDDPYSDGSISKDGTTVTVKCESENGSCMLFAVTPNGVKMISDRADKQSRFLTSDNGDIVAYTLTSPGALYIYEVSSGKSEIAVAEMTSEFSFVNNSKDITFLSTDNTLSSLDIASGKVKTLFKRVKEYFPLLDGARTVCLTEENNLFLYTDWSNSTETVAENVTAICPSEGNETFAYTTTLKELKTDSDGNVLTSECYFRNGQKEVYLGANITPVALDDDGENIYCRTENGALLLFDKNGKSVEPFDEKYNTFSLSSSLTELAFSAQDGIYLFSRKNGRVKISESTDCAPLLGENEEKIPRFSDKFYVQKNDDGTMSVIYVDASFTAYPVTEHAQATDLSEDGDTLFFENDGKIYASSFSNGIKTSEVCEGKLAEGEYYLSGGNAIYIKEKNEDDSYTLYWCKDGKKTAVSEHVVGNIYMSHDKNLFFTENVPSPESENEEIFSVDGIKGYPLYCVKNGGEKVHITDNMCRIKMSKSSAYIITPSANFNAETNPTFSVYGCVRGSNFKLILENITILKK